MTEILLNHIKKYISVDDEVSSSLMKIFSIHNAQKKEIIVAEGELCPRLYFVAKGCLRMYYFDEKGSEQTIQFALENWWMTDIEAFHKKNKAIFNIQAIENTTLLGVYKSDLDALLEKHPVLEKYFRIIYERAYSASLFRMKFFRLPKDEFYNLFRNQYPEFIQRIPQKLLASFLGFTPEYLSELRKKKNTPK